VKIVPEMTCNVSVATFSVTYYTVAQKLSAFSFHYDFYKCWPISMILGTHTELICNITVIDLPTSPTYWGNMAR